MESVLAVIQARVRTGARRDVHVAVTLARLRIPLRVQSIPLVGGHRAGPSTNNLHRVKQRVLTLALVVFSSLRCRK